jgi:hypothetical protein
VEIRSNSPSSWRIPIAIDPWQRFQPGWVEKYRMDEQANRFTWELGEDTRLEVSACSGLQESVFTDSRPQLTLAENPNYDYPPGHYLPFPMTVLEVSEETSSRSISR